MNTIDVMVAFYLLIGVRKGYKRGFCTEFSNVVGWTLILLTGSGLLHWVSTFLSTLLDLVPQVSNFLGFILIVVGTIIILFPLRTRLKNYIESNLEVDSHQALGAIMGGLRVSLVAALIISILGLIPIDAMQQYIFEGSYFGTIVNFLFIGS